jgi:histidyl-tRNA synthetase
VFVATIEKGEVARALAIADRLRQKGLAVVVDVMSRSLNAQMKQANRLGAAFVLFVDPTRAGLRDMATGHQVDFPLTDVENEVASQIAARKGEKNPR